MMTQKPSSLLARWKYGGVVPLLLMTLLMFSFRQRGNQVGSAPEIFQEGQNVARAEDNTEQPLFPGCEKVNEMEKSDCSHKKLYEYVASHLKYPEELRAAKIEGKVYVKFLITNNGYVSDARIQKSLHPAADKAALDVVNSMNDNVGKWTPGTKEGIPVTMDMFLPISFVLSDSTGSSSNDHTDAGNNKQGDPYTYVEEMPRFPGCEDLPTGSTADAGTGSDCSNEKLYTYIYEHIQYPKEDIVAGKEGQVIAQFTVKPDGIISDAHILRGVSPTMNAEVLRIINEMNDMPQHWIPGKKDGQPVAVLFTLPVKFKLQSENRAVKDTVTSLIAEAPAVEEIKEDPHYKTVEQEVKAAVAELHISPNPARDQMVIDLFEGAKSLFVFDAGGVLISNLDLTGTRDNQFQLDVSKYPAGHYSVRVSSATTSRSALFTVIK